MGAQELKHMARLAEWKEKVAACRSSGQTVKSWCQTQGIAIKTYYYWEKAVLVEAEKQLAVVESNGGANFVAVPAQLTGSCRQETHSGLAAKVRIGSGEVEIYRGAEAETIELLLRVLKSC